MQHYDGDNELQPAAGKTNVRATVDGNARRSRRYSSDESAAAQQDDSEMETYLDQYQQSTPMRPGMLLYYIRLVYTSRQLNTHETRLVYNIYVSIIIIILTLDPTSTSGNARFRLFQRNVRTMFYNYHTLIIFSFSFSSPLLHAGQRMGELDMFARPPADDDRPFRPSLDQYNWGSKQSQQHK